MNIPSSSIDSESCAADASNITVAPIKLYLYKLYFSPRAERIYKPTPYGNDAMISMIVAARDDMEARQMAIDKEYGGLFPFSNSDTSEFWGPTLDIQLLYIRCEVIGASFLFETPQIVMCNERHS